MKTALIYSTKYGSTEKVAREIAEKLDFPVDIINLADKKTDVRPYSHIILGMPVLAGNTTMDMRQFLKKDLDNISGKIKAVFILCWNSGKWKDYLHKLFKNNLPKDSIITHVGGEFNFDKMHDIEKNIVTELTGITETTSKISQSAINDFIDDINRRLG